MHALRITSEFALACVFLVSSAAWAEQESLPSSTTALDISKDSATDAPVLPLNEAVRIARERSPLAQSLATERTAAMAMARSANALPDPVVSVGVNNWPISGAARFRLDRQLPTSVAVGVSRKLTRRDKRQAKAQAFESQAALADAESAVALAQLSRATAIAWLDRSITRKLRALTVSQLEQNQRLLMSAEAAFRSGRDSQTSVFDARLAIERSHDRIDKINRELAIATVKLERRIGVAAKREPGEMPTLTWQPRSPDTDLVHPELLLAQARIRLNQAKAGVAKTAQRADWTVRLAYARRGAIFGDAVSLSFSIPWQWNRQTVQNEQWLASRERVTASEQRRKELLLSESSRIDTLAASLQFLNKRIARYLDQMLPIAAQRAQASLAAYKGGKGSLGEVLRARRAQLDLQMEAIALERNAAQVWAELTYLDVSGSNTVHEQENIK